MEENKFDILKDESKGTDLFAEPEKRPEKKPKNRKQWKKKSRTGRIVLLVILGILLLALIVLGVFAWHVCNRPNLFFDTVTRVSTVETPAVTPLFEIEKYLPTEEPGTTPMPIPVYIPTPAPVSTDMPEPAETQMPEEPEKLGGIVNIGLFGIDAFEDGSSSSGSMPHTDANIVLAINFDTKEISLISIARDCMTTAPGYTGFYKFNGVFNVGGGMEDPKAGFELSCRAAEEWLGGVSVPYYYGVDFQAVIDLVDMIGGIDFDVDIKLKTFDNRIIYPGKRHLDGYGVMAYIRARKSADGLDFNRTARQRKMMIAIFKKLKREGKLSMVPDILRTMGDNVYTNTTLSQTAALVNFAKDIDPDSIQSYSIHGKIRMQYDWAYAFIDQQKRIDILKEVYGIDAEPMRINSPVYEKYLHESGFRTIQYLSIAKKLFNAVHNSTSVDTMSEEQKTAYARCWQDYENLRTMFQTVDQWTQAHYDDSIRLTEEEIRERSAYYASLRELEAKLRESGDALNALFNNPIKPRWNRSVTFWDDKDSDINEVYVDFR